MTKKCKNTKASKIAQRDGNILKSYQREINLQTKSVDSKKKYSRKEKHKIKHQ